MDNTAEFEDLVRELDAFEQEAKELQEKVARLMHHAREVSAGCVGEAPETEMATEAAED